MYKRKNITLCKQRQNSKQFLRIYFLLLFIEHTYKYLLFYLPKYVSATAYMRHGFCTLSLLKIYFTSFNIQQPC
jgi:hypothetical protein